jgi:coproporphyrinogen III oxidase-like Fe-S oxidoreductase
MSSVAEGLHSPAPSDPEDPRDLSVYIHFPFCRQKCHFCDWVQRVPKSDLLRPAGDSKRAAYVSALTSELRTRGPQLREEGFRPGVVYWGGGTSTAMDSGEVETIVAAMADAFDLGHVREWTIEGSPDTVSLESLRDYRSLGFNRFSVGIQSFDDERLRRLGRRHSAEHGASAVLMARAAGFDNVSIDLMCGFPDEDLDEVRRSVGAAIELAPEHISFYTFRPSEGTVMRRAIDKARYELEIERQLVAYRVGSTLLQEAGFAEYGVGYFGRKALNVTEMFQLRCDVAGFGSGAVSISDRRYLGHTHGLLDRYIADPLSFDFAQPLVAPGVALSLLRAGLSIHGGIAAADWEARIGEPLAESMRRPRLKMLVDFLNQDGGLILDDTGVALEPERAAGIIIGVVNKLMMNPAEWAKQEAA